MKSLSSIIFASLLFSFTTLGPSQAKELTIMTHDSFNISRDVLAEFENTHNVQIRVIQTGDAGVALNQAILTKQSPLADIFYGVDNTFLSRALNADIFVEYQPARLDEIPQELRMDSSSKLIPVDFGDVCLNFDLNWFQTHNIVPPASLEELTAPQYADLIVIPNPATSSPGLAFLLATIAHFGEDKVWDFWRAMKKNKVLITGGWNDAYWGHFSAASKGQRPIVVSYATSPAAEVHFGNASEPSTVALLAPGSAFRQIEFAGILKNTPQTDLAKAFMDFVISPRFQEDIPLRMFVFPANPETRLPEVFQKYAHQASAPAQIDSELIHSKREDWISTWTALMLN